MIAIAVLYYDKAHTAVDRGSAAYATPTMNSGPGAYDAPILMSGHAIDWDLIGMAYPASTSNADRPFVGDGMLVGDGVGLLVGLGYDGVGYGDRRLEYDETCCFMC